MSDPGEDFYQQLEPVIPSCKNCGHDRFYHDRGYMFGAYQYGGCVGPSFEESCACLCYEPAPVDLRSLMEGP